MGGILPISVLLCFALQLFIFNGLSSVAMIVFDLIDDVSVSSAVSDS